MNEGVAGREGGGSGGIKHHGDKCEWVQRREAGFVGLEFKPLFCGTSLPQDTLQDTADSGTAECVCRGCMGPPSNMDTY